jgi:hypothetical protein
MFSKYISFIQNVKDGLHGAAFGSSPPRERRVREGRGAYAKATNIAQPHAFATLGLASTASARAHVRERAGRSSRQR